MVETENKSRNPLLEQIEEKRRYKESQRKAHEMVPEFKCMLGILILAKVPVPEVETVKFKAWDYDIHDIHKSVDQGKLDTKLTATIPLEGGETSVTISASGYPESGNADSAKSLDYEVDVAELDSVLIIRGAEAKVQSKERESEAFTRTTPIGSYLRSWPSWSHAATVEDLQAYESLLKMCFTQEGVTFVGVTFKGSTPPVVKVDYSEIRAKIKKPRRAQILPPRG